MLDYDRKRLELLSEHDLLRVLLSRVNASAEQVQQRDPLGAARLRTSLPTLRACFESHLKHEEALLLPILSRLDAWGPVRVERLREEHAHQRRMLSAIAHDIERGAEDYLVAVQAIELVKALLDDMEAEERDLFDSTQLHDDPCVADQSDA